MANELEGTPVATVEDEFSFEVVDTPEEGQKDEATLALEGKLAEQEALIKQLQEQQLTAQAQATTGNQMEELAKLIAEQKQEAPSQTLPPSVEEQQAQYQALMDDVRKNWHSDPAGNSIKLIEPLLQQMQNQNTAVMQKQSVQLSKISALQGADAEYMQKYGSEVESIVSTLPPSDTVYQEALGRVKLLHQEDIINEKVNAKVQAQLDEMEKKLEAMGAGGTDSAPPQDVADKAPFSLANTPPASAQNFQKQKNRITTQEQSKLQQYAMNHMIPWNNPSYRNMLVDKYKKGEIVLR